MMSFVQLCLFHFTRTINLELTNTEVGFPNAYSLFLNLKFNCLNRTRRSYGISILCIAKFDNTVCTIGECIKTQVTT
jgi:hypothetical protein